MSKMSATSHHRNTLSTASPEVRLLQPNDALILVRVARYQEGDIVISEKLKNMLSEEGKLIARALTDPNDPHVDSSVRETALELRSWAKNLNAGTRARIMRKAAKGSRDSTHSVKSNLSKSNIRAMLRDLASKEA